MPTTTKGLRYPASTDKIGDAHQHIQNLAEDVDAQLGGTWGARESLIPKLSAGFTSTLFDIRRSGKLREVRVSISGTIPTGSTNFVAVGGLGADDRPSFSAFAFAYLSGATAGSVFLRADGSFAVANMSGASRTTAQGTIIYTVE